MSDIVNPTPVIKTEDRSLEVLCHLLGLAGFAIPFGNILAPLFLWIWKKDTHPGVDVHGKEALNFQISMTIYGLIGAVTAFFLIGFVILALVFIVSLVLIIIAAREASKGNLYRYPLTIRMIK